MSDRPKLPDGPMFCSGPYHYDRHTAKVFGVGAWGGPCQVLDMRGWGYLTGHGQALALDAAKARAATDLAGEWIAAAMNAKAALAGDMTQLADAVKEAENG